MNYNPSMREAVQNSQRNQQGLRPPPPASLAYGSDYADGGKKGRAWLHYVSARRSQEPDYAAIGIALCYRIPKTAPEPSVFSIWFDS